MALMRPVSQRVVQSLSYFFGSLAAWAAITGSISGVVTDPSGAVVPGIRVTTTSVSTNLQSATVTDAKPVAVATGRLPKDATTNSSDSYKFTQQKDNSLTFEFANGTTLILSSPHKDGSRQGKA
jgi:hypothetical protein